LLFVSQISGIVQDESGVSSPGADVTVTQTDTGGRRDVVTDTARAYLLSNLPIGPYRLEAADPRIMQVPVKFGF
jgi:Carboxypeptidase regulatory-like domain